MSELTRIGLLAGMSWQSSQQYYRRLNELVGERVGGYASAPVTLHSVDFAEIHELQLAGDWEAQGRLLNRAALALQAGGVQAVALATNTLHLVAEQISAGLDVPFLDLIDLVGDAVAASGTKTVGLLATGYTMRSDLYARRLEKFGVEVLVPQSDDLELAHQIIYSELVKAVITPDSRARYLEVIDRLVDRGATGVILGCTEIPLLLRQSDTPIPLFDTTELHCQVLADVIINGAQK
ncbi:aspartate racemase [Jatrophihabitans sp. GAS493]|uniref:aspartate/glutamate racemase family protein n=1 Tax=Jatrophihabitans sp. GAS493 TaxID=1907575 RepID=UPI000BBF78A5|nr:aspartate/glutamate racemase family protein [Jatrophihabitans sp. GAS493]SOD73384.1 aspartate racemase [Jatrophihabitans sp. GAS493]